MIWHLFWYINLLVQTVVLATLVEIVIILKLGLRNLLERITNLIFLNIYTPPQYALTHNSLSFKIIDKANSKFAWKLKEAVHFVWRKPNLNSQQSHTFTLSLCHPFGSFFSFFAFLFHLLFPASFAVLITLHY